MLERDAGARQGANRPDRVVGTVPHSCYTDSLTVLAHGDSCAVGNAVDLQFRR